MTTFAKSFLIVAVAIAAMIVAGLAEATKLKAPADEVVLLPQFCWAQYMPGIEGPQYSINGCGVWMNHYCPGLLELIRARKPNTTRGQKIQHLKVAKSATEYTLMHMEDHPVCSIRKQAQETLQQINMLLRLYGQK